MNENERPITGEIIMRALVNKEIIIQKSKSISKKESNIDKLNRRVNRLLYY